jgi:anti-sigma regulatory factor (Ser/Thr protein kinase)
MNRHGFPAATRGHAEQQMDAHGTLDLTLRSQPASVAEARTRVCEAIEPELSDGACDTLRLLVSEVVTNAVRHGGDDHPVEVRASWNSEVRVEVSDHGTGFAPAPRLAAPDEPGGFGLFLVGRLADRWGVETDRGTTVWFVLQR